MADAEASTVFSLEEKNRLRYHLGYLVVQPVLTIQLGVPAVSQTGFLLEAAMDRVPLSAAGMVRGLLSKLDVIEDDMFRARRRLAARELGELTLNPDNEIGQLEGEHDRWAKRLADLLGVMPNPYSQRQFSGDKAPLVRPVFR